MLNFVEPRAAVHYFVLVLIGFSGVLQIVAARYQLKSLSLIPNRWPAWLGTLLGPTMITSAFVWFIVATPEMFRPGPAGFEISLLFATATLLAALMCRFTVALSKR